LFGSYTLDIIASCAFGTKIDNLSDPDNEFVASAKAFFRPGAFNNPLVLIPCRFQQQTSIFIGSLVQTFSEFPNVFNNTVNLYTGDACFIAVMFPWMVKRLGVEIFPTKPVFFYANLVRSIIANRRKETTVSDKNQTTILYA
jgi:hypothetical protein